MKPEQERKARELYRVVADMTTDERTIFLETVCADDETVRLEVERLAETATFARPPSAPSAAAVSGTPKVGDRIGPYELKAKLGEGGMGIVFEALQREPIRRKVALKVIKPGMDSGQVLARFDSERQALALMDHPNIAKVFDAGATERGQPYFVMEHVPGVPLCRHCDEATLTTHDRLELLAQVCDGIQHAHQKGIIHRDLKPTNILVRERDGEPEVKIIDFGVARATDQQLTEMAVFTELGMMVGTPEYMSPEQAAGRNLDIDTRTDVYALGVVLYQLLVGHLPLEVARLRRAGYEAILQKIREEEPSKPSTRLDSLGDEITEIAEHHHTRPRAMLREVRGDLDWITMKALEKDRERRYESASALAADIRRYLRDEPVLAGPPSAVYRARKFVRRHRLGVAVAATLALSIVVGATASTIGFVRAVRAERLALFEADTSKEVIEFLVGLFKISDPGEARGNEITAREILDRGVESIDTGLVDRPELRGRLLDVMGLVYRSLGLHAAAVPLLERALEDRRRAHGESSPEVADTLNSLAALLLLQHRSDEARPLLERAWAIQEVALAADDPRRGRTLNNLAYVARRQRRYDDALELYRRAHRIRLAALGPDDPELIKTLSNIGALQRVMGEEEASLEAYEQALAIAERGLPDDHPMLARVLNNLATLHRKSGRPAEARTILARAIPIYEKVYGPEHPETVKALVNLGEVQAALGEDQAAAATLDRAIEAGVASLGAKRSVVIQAFELQVEVLRRLGREEDAALLRARFAQPGVGREPSDH